MPTSRSSIGATSEAGHGRLRQKWYGWFPTREQAEETRRHLTGASSEVAVPSGVTLREWVISEWLPSMRTQLKPSTWDSYQRNMRLHVLPTLGEVPLVQLTPRTLNRLHAALPETGNRAKPGGLSAKTVRYIHTTIRTAPADAVDVGELTANPAQRARPPRFRPTVATEIRFWTAAQLGRFLEATGDHRLSAA